MSENFDPSAQVVAEHAIAMMFAAARQIPAADQGTQAGKWPKKHFVGTELSYKTLGLIGCGNIGARVAERAKGLTMKVVAYDPFLTEERAVELGVAEGTPLLHIRRIALDYNNAPIELRLSWVTTAALHYQTEV